MGKDIKIPNQVASTNFKTLIVYQKSLSLMKTMYKISDILPEKEKYAMCKQIIRAVTSITANIAEGFGQVYLGHRFNFINISIGSCNEIKSWLDMAHVLEYIDEQSYQKADEQATEVLKILIGCLRKTKQEMQNNASTTTN